MYVNHETISEEEHFPYTKTFVENYKKMSNPGPVPKTGFYLVTYIHNIVS